VITSAFLTVRVSGFVVNVVCRAFAIPIVVNGSARLIFVREVVVVQYHDISSLKESEICVVTITRRVGVVNNNFNRAGMLSGFRVGALEGESGF